METELFYGGGGWFPSVGTGSVFQRVAKAAVVCASALLIGTGGIATAKYFSKRHEHGYRFEHVQSASAASEGSTISAAAKLELVRHVFKPSVTDLAETFGVSRQAIYNWNSGAVPSERAAILLDNLADAASVFLEADVVANPYLLRRKLQGNLTLLEAIRSGASGGLAAQRLIQQLGDELRQRSLIDRRLAGRSGPKASADELPGSPHLQENS